MKVYLVVNTYGSYEDVAQSIDKIFDTAEKADQYVKNVKARIEELKKLFNNMSDTGHDENDSIYDKAVDQFDADFPDTYYDTWDGNYFHILEHEVE